MAAVAPQEDQATDLFQKLSLDSQNKASDIPEATKKLSVDSGNMANGVQSDRSTTPLLPDLMNPAMFYPPNGYPSTAYYYGYDANGSDWGEDYTRYMNPDGVEMNPGAYGDNSSLMYHHAYGYTPYNPYSPAVSPVPAVGHDAQMYGAQHYQYPYFQSFTPTSGLNSTPAAPLKGELATSATADQAPLSLNSAKSKSNGITNGGNAKVNNGTVPARPTYQNSSYNVNETYGRGALTGGFPASGYQDTRFRFDALQSPNTWYESPYFSDAYNRPITSSSMNSAIATGNGLHSSRNQNYQPHLMGLNHSMQMSGTNTTAAYTNRMYPNKLYDQFGNSYRPGLGYGSNSCVPQANGRGWMSVDSKYKPRGRGSFCGSGNESIDGLNELNRGPRAKVIKNQKGFTPVALAVKGQSIPLLGMTDEEKPKLSSSPDQEIYNRPDFAETCADGKFFIIKSYSEDDVHKSIKYNVWSSTQNGNKKLDAAYVDAQQKSAGCPIFLFFSVNASGQFVGVAEMVGPVDFDKKVEYWQQDKWIGCFPVKWHIVKDVPNSSLKHIILEYNENKPVTNSRDTQEVKLDQGLEMLKIFKDHTSKQCILDDFYFYEDRQKRIQEKKSKQLQQYQKQAQQASEEKAIEEKNKLSSNSDVKSHISSEMASDLFASAVQTNGDDTATEKSSLSKSSEVVQTATPAVSEKKLVANV